MPYFTFETEYPPPFKAGWMESKQRFETVEDAVIAAAEWLQVCAENGCFVAIRVKEGRIDER